MTTLPTCWYCPECGMVFNYQLEAEAGHVGGLPGFLECENEAIVEVPLIPPGTPLPVILDTLGIKCRSLYTSADWVDPELIVLAVLEPSRIDGDVQVLVVDNPATDEARDA